MASLRSRARNSRGIRYRLQTCRRSLLLAAGNTSKDLLEVYMREGQSIFPPGSSDGWRVVRGLALYRYERTALTSALESALGTLTLAQSAGQAYPVQDNDRRAVDLRNPGERLGTSPAQPHR